MMKRSTQIGLFLVGTLGVTSASGYYLMNRNQACRQNPDRTDQDCRHSGTGHGGGSGRPLFGSSSMSPSGTSSPSSSAERGGFGATGRAVGLSGS
jgi:hypothetical protein